MCLCVCLTITIVFLLLLLSSVSSGHTEAGVSQSPRHKVTKRGQNVTFRCDPISGHIGLYWYQQMVGEGPTFLVYFQNNDPVDTSGMPNNRFSAVRSESSSSTLSIQPAEPGDSAVYLCASSATTVWHHHHLPAHKPSCGPLCSWFPGSLARRCQQRCCTSGHLRVLWNQGVRCRRGPESEGG